MDAGLQQSNALYATGMNEKEIESADLSSWFSEVESNELHLLALL